MVLTRIGMGLGVCRHLSFCPAGSHVEHAPSFTPSALYASLMGTVGSKAQLDEPLLFNGLRVRMGVVTGEVPSGTSIKNSALFQLAKG